MAATSWCPKNNSSKTRRIATEIFQKSFAKSLKNTCPEIYFHCSFRYTVCSLDRKRKEILRRYYWRVLPIFSEEFF